MMLDKEEMNAARQPGESPVMDGIGLGVIPRLLLETEEAYNLLRELTKDQPKQYAPENRVSPAQIIKDVLLGTLAASYLGYGLDDAELALQELGLDVHPARRKLTMWLEKDFLQPSAQLNPALHPASGAGKTIPDRGQAIAEPDGLQKLPDNIVLAPFVARRNVERLAPEQVTGYLLREVVPAMQRFHRKGEAPERVLSLFVIPAHGYIALKWTKDRIEALLRLAAYLETQPSRTSLFYATYAQLAEFLDSEASQEHLPAVAAIYHRVLIHPPPIDVDGVAVMASVANNLTIGLINALRNAYDDTDIQMQKNAPVQTLQAVNRIHTLSAVSAVREKKCGVSADPEKLRRLRLALAKIPGLRLPDIVASGSPVPDDVTEADLTMALWMMMTNVLSAWHCPDPSFFGRDIPERLDDQALTPLTLAGALARIELGKTGERYEIGIIFAKLSNMVAGSSTDKTSRAATISAACLAAVGLWQVAVLGENDIEILGHYHGLAICTCLLAHLDDIPQEKLFKLDGLPDMLAWLANAGGRMEIDAFKRIIMRLLERKNFKHLLAQGNVPGSHEALVRALSMLTQALLHDLAGNNDTPPTLNVSDATASTASIAVFVLQKIIGEEKFAEYVSVLNDITGRLLEAAQDIDQVWQTLYGPETLLPGEAETSQRPGLVGPLAALEYAPGKKIFSEDEWSRCLNIITQRSEVDPIQAVKDLLSEDDSKDTNTAGSSSEVRLAA